MSLTALLLYVRLMEANQQLEKKAHAQKARIHNLEADARKMKDSLQVWSTLFTRRVGGMRQCSFL